MVVQQSIGRQKRLIEQSPPIGPAVVALNRMRTLSDNVSSVNSSRIHLLQMLQASKPWAQRQQRTAKKSSTGKCAMHGEMPW